MVFSGYCFIAGWSSLVARKAHNLEVGGSNPSPATNKFKFFLESIFLMLPKTYEASCKCNNINYIFTTLVSLDLWPVRKCNCSFCSKRVNHIHCSDPKGSVTFLFLNPQNVTLYRHGTKTADFVICKTCNSYMAAVMPTNKGRFSVINLEHLIDKINFTKINNLSWVDEGLESRLARRHITWTPVKEYKL